MKAAENAAHFPPGRQRLSVLPLVWLIRLYQVTLAQLVPAGTCKYHPSCSQYAIDALRRHGLVKGSLKAAWRLLRCNPWSHGGVDPA